MLPEKNPKFAAHLISVQEFGNVHQPIPFMGGLENFLVSAFVVHLNLTDEGGAHCKDMKWLIKQLTTKGQLKLGHQGLLDAVEMSVTEGVITFWVMGEGLSSLEDTFDLSC